VRIGVLEALRLTDPVLQSYVPYDDDDRPLSHCFSDANVHLITSNYGASSTRWCHAPFILELAADRFVLVKSVKGVEGLVTDAAGADRRIALQLMEALDPKEVHECYAIFSSPRRAALRHLHTVGGAVARYVFTELAGALFAIASAVGSRAAIDAVIAGTVRNCVVSAIGVAVCDAMGALTFYFGARALRYMATSGDYVVRLGFASNTFNSRYEELHSLGASALVDASRRLDGAASAYGRIVLGLTMEVARCLLFATFLFALSPSLALILGFAAVVSVMLTARTAQRMTALHAREQAAHRNFCDGLGEAIVGNAALRARGAFGRFLGRCRVPLQQELLAGKARQDYGLRIPAYFNFFEGCALALSIAMLAHECIAGSRPAGELLEGLQLTHFFVGSTMALVRLAQDVIAMKVSAAPAEIVSRSLAGAREDATSSKVSDGMANGDAVVVANVWFQYLRSERWVVSSASLSVPAGTFFTLRGPSGSGKTTLLRLVAGLLSPSRGEVLVFGLAPARLRSEIFYLPQRTSLYDASILDNLRMLAGGASDAAIVEAAAESGLTEWLRRLPMGFETRVPYGGGTISGGQRQLIAVTAAAASKSPLLLLDESFSHMDNLMRARLIEANIFRNRTVISVAHD
jgi:ATP-binding cassette, subfamily B, bacterial